MTQTGMPPSSYAAVIREIGRGKHGARDLTREQARDLYAAMLAGQVSQLELGAILIAMRIKGETATEIDGFLDAAHAATRKLAAQRPSPYLPILIPSYNGARKLPNLTPLLATLLARAGALVLVHGVLQDTGRVTSHDIFLEMGQQPCLDQIDIDRCQDQGQAAFMPINALSEQMHALLALRQILGLRNSTHTLVKMLQPFEGPALRLTSFTHPEYDAMLREFFTGPASANRGPVLLMRGTEGETVAHPVKSQAVTCFENGEAELMAERHSIISDDISGLPPKDAKSTASWIARVLDGTIPVPPAITAQVDLCLTMAHKNRESVAKVTGTAAN